MSHENRRKFERFELPHAYTGIAVRTLDGAEFVDDGHAYDVSEAGVQFELDRPVAPGTSVMLRIDLPESVAGEKHERHVLAFGNIIWTDESEPGPVRHAAAFTRFLRPADRERLLNVFAARKLRRAA
ncbi:MAG TPA: PilZ domain-containing protein [Phycisphaerales bacterium]|nr:PilZ domain-containing protein [Phycisphaerales bacterium]